MAKGKKTGGRKKGTPNKKKAGTPRKIVEIIESKLDRLSEELDNISDSEKFVDRMIRLMEFAYPKIKEASPDEIKETNDFKSKLRQMAENDNFLQD